MEWYVQSSTHCDGIRHALTHYVRHVSNTLCCVFCHLSSTVLNFITAAGRPQASVAALYAGSGFALAFLTFLLLFLKQILKQSLWAQLGFYSIMFRKTAVGLFGMRKERLLSPSTFWKIGKVLRVLKSSGTGWFNRLASMQHLVSFMQLLWTDFPWAVTEQDFRRTWIRIWEFESWRGGAGGGGGECG